MAGFAWSGTGTANSIIQQEYNIRQQMAEAIGLACIKHRRAFNSPEGAENSPEGAENSPEEPKPNKVLLLEEI